MKSVLERFLEFVAIDTQSDEKSKTHPSSAGQLTLGRLLAGELRKLKAEKIRLTPEGYVFGLFPATAGCETAPALGLIAHMDTSDAASGKDIKPRLVSYSGTPIPLGAGSRILDPALFPALREVVGDTLVVTDGTTLLGADDKAGIAEILCAVETLLVEKRPHGPLCIGFTPDEEIGEGTLFFDVQEFGARFAYTVDGGSANEVEYQNFNAALATFSIKGFSVHPGSAKGIMRNAQKIAFELDAMLPPREVPEETERFEGFFHLIESSGTVSAAQAVYLVRDHDAALFAARLQLLCEIAHTLNVRYGKGSVVLTVKEQYRNMEEIIRCHPELIEIACDAIRAAGGEPSIVPIRGGTDGAMLSWKGLPCPNLGTGGYNFHGECEFASVPQMERTVKTLLNIIERFTRQ